MQNPKRPTSLPHIALLVLAGIIVSLKPAGAATLDVMSFNIRNVEGFNRLLTPPNGWFDIADLGNPDGFVNGRRLRALAVIAINDPDILGVQEADQIQVDDVLGVFPQYEYFGAGREDGLQTGEQSGIFYRADRFTRLDGGHFWLSETPTVPGTTFATGTDSGNPRMATWAVLEDALTGGSLFVLNTHWSLNTSARSASAELIRAQLAVLAGDLPTLVMGDLNTSETRTAFELLRDGIAPGDRPFIDAYREVFPIKQTGERTFHDFLGGTLGSRIDHILYSEGDFQALDASIDRTRFAGLYPSDHYPVTATLLVPELSTLGLLALGGVLFLAIFRPHLRSTRGFLR